MRERWEHQVPGVPLVIVESPYRALAGPLMAYLDVLDRAWPPDKPEPITFVVIPEYVARSWWERILYNQSARRLRTVAARPAAHGRRRRAVPPRRRPPVQGAGAAGAAAMATTTATRRRAPHGRRDGRAGRGHLDSRWRPRHGRRRRLRRAAVYRDAARRPVETRPRSPVRGRRERGGSWFVADSAAPQFRRAVVALSGGRTDRPIVALAAEAGAGRPGRARRRPRRRDRLDAAARRGRGGPVRGRPAGPRHRRGHGRGRPLQAWRPCCSRRATSGRRSSTRRPSATPTSSSPGCRSGAGSAATSPSGAPFPTS